MDENVIIYKYDKRYEQYKNLEEWLMTIPESEWLYLRMLTDTPERRELTEDEICYLAEIALPMYCQEMDIEELPYDVEFLNTMVGFLLTAIVVLSLKFKGLVETNEPVMLHKDYNINKTTKLDVYMLENKITQ